MNTPSKLIVPDRVSEFPKPAPVVSESAAMLGMIERASRDETVDMDKMERLWKMRQQILNDERKAAYNAAMALCQAEMLPVTRDAQNSQTNSMYATLEAIDEAIRPIYTKHGFALSFDQGDCPVADHVRILCEVSHAGGYTVPKHWDLPLDSVGMKGNANKTLVHANGSTISYGRRYLTCMVFNVTLKNEDKDGNKPDDRPRISLEQLNELEKLIADVAAGREKFREKFMAYVKIKSMGDILACNFDTVKQLIESRRQKPKAEAK